MSSFKSDSTCEEFRKEGNQFYQQNKFIDALAYYNKALCYAEKIDSKEAALVFANRSAVYINLGLPELCLKNIEHARNAGYPAEKVQSLNNREKKCRKMIVQKDPAAKEEEVKDPVNDFFKLSYPAHEKIPFLANCVEMRENKKYRRGLYATQDLKPGDVIAIDEPVMKSLYKNGLYKRCTNCIEVKDMDLMPCSGCVFAMFCSKKCQDEAMEKFHQFECPHLDSFCYEDVRFFFEALHAAGGLNKLKAICADKQMKQKTFFDYDLSKDNNPSLELNQLLAMIGQLSVVVKPNQQLRELNIDHCIDEQPIRSAWKTQEEKNDVGQILMELSCIALHEKVDNPYEAYGGRLEKYEVCFGSCVNLVMPYFNHSCSPNVTTLSVGIQIIYIVDCPIKKDEQIFESVG